MSAALLALLEKLVMSPAVQEAAWDLIKNALASGTEPSADVIAQADRLADEAHAAVQAG